MQAYLETIGVLGVAVFGLLAGKAFSKLRRPYWLGGYFLSLILTAILILPHLYYTAQFVPLLGVLLAGRIRFIILGFAVSVGLIGPIDRLPYRLEKVLVCVLMSVVIGWFTVMPFLAPALLQDSLASLKTNINTQGICFQSTDYTCGPAAAVTALNQFGIKADEGRIAILSHTSPVIGTLPKCLADALTKQYSDEGLECNFRFFDSIDQLADADVTLVVVKDHFLADHCVAVLNVDDENVTVADPVLGKCVISREDFADEWRFSGIAIKRHPTAVQSIDSGLGQSSSI
jgi:predicted double-glycine peptidase